MSSCFCCSFFFVFLEWWCAIYIFSKCNIASVVPLHYYDFCTLIFVHAKMLN